MVQMPAAMLALPPTSVRQLSRCRAAMASATPAAATPATQLQAVGPQR